MLQLLCPLIIILSLFPLVAHCSTSYQSSSSSSSTSFSSSSSAASTSYSSSSDSLPPNIAPPNVSSPSPSAFMSLLSRSNPDEQGYNADELFESWKAERKNVLVNENEEQARTNFVLHLAAQRTFVNSDAELKPHAYMHLAPTTFRSRVNGFRYSNRHLKGEMNHYYFKSKNFPLAPPVVRAKPTQTQLNNLQAIDWRTSSKPVLSPVINQQNCGDCWAYSIVGTLESARALGGLGITSLSVQQVTSCAHGSNTHGCKGGDTDEGIGYLMNTGLISAEEYPMQQDVLEGRGDGTCLVNDPLSPLAVAKSFVITPCLHLVSDWSEECVNQDESVLAAALLEGPVSVVIDASKIPMNFPSDGVITPASGCRSNVGSADHAVILVGIRKTETGAHYIVKNTWGPEFGDKGYFYMSYGTNTCGVANYPIRIRAHPNQPVHSLNKQQSTPDPQQAERISSRERTRYSY